MERKTFIPYSASVLPDTFNYPKSYLLISNNLSSINQIEGFPWWFEDGVDDLHDVQKIYGELTGDADLIPFARDGDWAACFKGSDTSENPKVYVYDLVNYINRYELNNFDVWLDFVIKECH